MVLIKYNKVSQLAHTVINCVKCRGATVLHLQLADEKSEGRVCKKCWKIVNIDTNKTILLSLFVHNLAPISHRLAVNATRFSHIRTSSLWFIDTTVVFYDNRRNQDSLNVQRSFQSTHLVTASMAYRHKHEAKTYTPGCRRSVAHFHTVFTTCI
jgi:hypothetical protein